MAQSYNLEPQPTAKVLLQTTGGDLLLELFAKQTPITSRNFLQLCLDGYYDGTIFHRVVPNFIFQGGDPTGTGSGGESSLEGGEPVPDEFHSRLKFNRRGLLGMANTGKKDDNGSQFFLTLGDTQELTGKNTMFGRIAGDTIYNLVKMAEGELAEGMDRPLYPEKITGTQILVNPFEGMVKRQLTQRAPIMEDRPKKAKKKVVKASLNFGEDDDSLSLAPPVKRLKVNPRFQAGDKSTPAAPSTQPEPKPPSAKDRAAQKVEDVAPRARSPPVTRRKSPSPELLASSQPLQRVNGGRRRSSSASSIASDRSEPTINRNDAQIASTNAQIEALKASMRRKEPSRRSEEVKPKSGLEAFIPSTSTRGRKRGAQSGKSYMGGNMSGSEQQALSMFNAFRSKLQAAPVNGGGDSVAAADEGEAVNGTVHGGNDANEEDEANLCDLHFVPNCQSCTKWDQMDKEEDEDVSEGWMSHQLSFARDRLGKDLEWKRKNEEELVVIDPREREKDLAVKSRRGDRGSGGRDHRPSQSHGNRDRDRRR